MAGGTLNHGLICGNIFGELRAGLKAKAQDCAAGVIKITASAAIGRLA